MIELNENDYMKLAIEEAKKGMGFTSPNPLVGAVLVKDGVILGRDYHHKYGELHAERNVLLNCKEDVRGADLYVTLEPCAHLGKTPPCTDIILEKGISSVLPTLIRLFLEREKIYSKATELWSKAACSSESAMNLTSPFFTI